MTSRRGSHWLSQCNLPLHLRAHILPVHSVSRMPILLYTISSIQGPASMLGKSNKSFKRLKYNEGVCDSPTSTHSPLVCSRRPNSTGCPTQHLLLLYPESGRGMGGRCWSLVPIHPFHTLIRATQVQASSKQHSPVPVG
ncbi:hypothetical protein SCLCIDRAFT_1218895 [Scleroderma citrinum Foug A]|uniref:Uncharacterized protein n=1 Tax=Scleroderma citrinum Foug A TaxID=1036808 RepID=A0A0C3DBT1_9AGAM|nr:hypothetical protein SCLCIDRAFT_1218895 [Scleroderma citrinum Foug A]